LIYDIHLESLLSRNKYWTRQRAIE